MSPKLRELVKSLEKAGFRNRVKTRGKDSHRNLVHPNVSKPVTISGELGDDVKKYQVRVVEKAFQEAKK